MNQLGIFVIFSLLVRLCSGFVPVCSNKDDWDLVKDKNGNLGSCFQQKYVLMKFSAPSSDTSRPSKWYRALQDKTTLNNGEINQEGFTNQITIVNPYPQWDKVKSMIVQVIENEKVVKMVKLRPNIDVFRTFAKENVMSSSWNGVNSNFAGNYFSITGHAAHYRRFFINNNYGGCGSDAGWLVVVGAKTPCGWEARSAHGTILYSKGDHAVNWQHGSPGKADHLLILLELEEPPRAMDITYTPKTTYYEVRCESSSSSNNMNVRTGSYETTENTCGLTSNIAKWIPSSRNLKLEVCVDGRDDLHIKDNKFWFHHLNFEVPAGPHNCPSYRQIKIDDDLYSLQWNADKSPVWENCEGEKKIFR